MSTHKVEYILSLKDLITQGLQGITGHAERLDNTMDRLQSTIMNVGATIGIAFGVNSIKDFVENVVEAGSKVETARIGLTTLLREGYKANEVISNTMSDAVKTPFDFDGLLQGNKLLISTGLDAATAREDILNLANAIAATGGGNDELSRMAVNMQQIRNVGQATAMDIKQFAFAGINVYKILADSTGKTVQQVQDMEISYEMLTDALRKAHDQGGLYANGLENMMGSTAQRISSMKEELNLLQVKMFDDMKPVIDWFISGMSASVEILREVWDWTVKNVEVFKTLGVVLGTITALYGTYLLVVNASTIATGLNTAAQWAWNAALNANPIGIVITAIGLFAGALYEAYKSSAEVRGIVLATWGVLQEFGRTVIDIFAGLADVLMGILTFDPDQVNRGADRAIESVRTSAERIGRAAREGYQKGIAEFNEEDKVVGDATYFKPQTTALKKPAPVVGTKGKGDSSKVTGPKAVTINIDINNLVNTLNINTTNVKDMPAKIKEEVVKALLSAVNDSQIVAGT